MSMIYNIPVMNLRLRHLLTGLFLGFAIFFGTGAGHALLSAAAMPDMNTMGTGSCQAACTPQTQPVAIRPTSEINEQNVDPQPAEPYYLAFIGVGWATVITIAAAYLLKYLRWRPPDLFKLHVAYRF